MNTPPPTTVHPTPPRDIRCSRMAITYLCAPRTIDRTIQFSGSDTIYIEYHHVAFDCRPTRFYYDTIVCFIVQPSVGLPSARSTKRDTNCAEYHVNIVIIPTERV